MSKKDDTVRGVILEKYAGARYLIQLEDGREIKGYMSGKMKQSSIQIIIGDKVDVVLDPMGGNATNRVVWRY